MNANVESVEKESKYQDKISMGTESSVVSPEEIWCRIMDSLNLKARYWVITEIRKSGKIPAQMTDTEKAEFLVDKMKVNSIFKKVSFTGDCAARNVIRSLYRDYRKRKPEYLHMYLESDVYEW